MHVAKIVMTDLGEVLRESYNPLKVVVSVLLINYLCYSSGHKSVRGKTPSREAFLFGVLHARGVCKAERPSQS
jgi:hypothetical protein